MTLLKGKKRKRHVLKAGAVILTGCLIMLFSGFARPGPETSDKERLGMALEYFQSGKYHEAILLFGKLDKSYRLNPRFKAYMGVCHFYQKDYRNASKCFTEAIPQLESFAPHERSVYYYMAAQSLFMTEKYAEAIPLYESAFNVCYENEKGDALFGMASCYEKMGDSVTAYELYNSARHYYTRFNDTTDKKGNMAKIDSAMNTGGQ